MGTSISPILVVLAIALAASSMTLWVMLRRVQQKLTTFMSGKDGISLEAALAKLTQKTAHIETTLDAHREGLEYIDARVKHSIRGYAVVRYNAFDTAGGEQSFAVAFINEQKDGYIFSVITNRNHVGIYAKKINAGSPEATLTHEESQALTQSITSLHL